MKLAPIVLVVGACLPALGADGPSLTAPDTAPPPVVDQPAVLPAPSPLRSLAQDERLAKAVTLRCRRRPVADVLTEITRQTGVTISAASEVAEEPVVVYMHDRPAREVMQHLAEHFNYQWRRGTANGETVYELYQDAASRRQEQALHDDDTRRMWDRLSRLVRHLQQLSNRPPAEVEQAFKADQAGQMEFVRRYQAASPGDKKRLWSEEGARWRDFDANWLAYHAASQPIGRALLRLASQVAPRGWERIREGGVVYFDPSGGPGTLQMPVPLARELAASTPSLPTRVGRKSRDQTDGKPDPMEVDLKAVQDEWLHTDDRRVVVGLGEPNPDLLALEIEPVALRDRSRSLGFYALGRLQIRILRQDQQPETGSDTPPEEWKTHPVLGRKKTPRFTPSDDPWRETAPPFNQKPILRTADLAAQLAEAYDLDLIADGYRYQDLYHSQEGFGDGLPDGRTEMPLWQALNRWVRPKSDWNLGGEILHVRRKHWYDVRLNEIPASVAERWSQRFHHNPALTLNDAVALLQQLRTGQLEEFVGVMRERGVYLGEMFDERLAGAGQPGRAEGHLLRAVAALPTRILTRLEQGQPLRYTELTPRAQAELRALQAELDRTNPGPGPRLETPTAELALASVTLGRTFTRRESNKTTEVQYAVQPPEDPSEKDLWKAFLGDDIIDAPGLRPIQAGNASGIRLTFRTATERIVGCIPLPWAAVRDLPSKERKKEGE